MIKLFEQYNEYSQVKEWLDKKSIMNYTINNDLTVDVNGGVNLNSNRYNSDGLSEIPIQFGEVSGDFLIANNMLTTLVGSPKKVGGTFNCLGNELTSLKGGPIEVNGNFDCYNNKLTSLEGCPQYIGHHFKGDGNNIVTLKYVPKNFGVMDISYKTLPREVELFCYLSNTKTKLLFKHQEDYGIWNTDGSFNKGRWGIFLQDYQAGMIK